MAGIPFSGFSPLAYADDAEWGVTESGSPGVFSWQHLFNWNLAGLLQTPLAIPSGIGESADLSKVDLTGNQTIQLDGAVTLGSLTVGDLLGKQSYIIAPGTGGR